MQHFISRVWHRPEQRPLGSVLGCFRTHRKYSGGACVKECLPNTFMLTPRFTVDQQSDTLTVCVRVPFSRPRDFTITTVETAFHFHCRPYLLHLNFPHGLRPIPDDDPSFATSSASYDFDTGIATIVLVKASPGLDFPALSCLSELLVTRTSSLGLEPSKSAAASISVVSSSVSNADGGVSASDGSAPSDAACNSLEPTGSSLLESMASISLDSKQMQPREEPDQHDDKISRQSPSHDIVLATPSYGFGNRYSGVFTARAEDASEIVGLSEPDSTPARLRSRLRRDDEFTRFDPEHYVADHMLVAELQEVISWQPGEDLASAEWNTREQELLLRLPRREYLGDLDSSTCADLASIVFAALYDLRAGAGERNVESAWTISRLSPVLSWLEHAESVANALKAPFCRSLVYPLYRNVDVAQAVLADVKRLFIGDVDEIRKRLLRLLLDVREVFENAVVLRIFSDIFLTDYCVWIQLVSDGSLQKLAREVADVSISFDALPWDLRRLQRYPEQLDEGVAPDDNGPVWYWEGQPPMDDPEGRYGSSPETKKGHALRETGVEAMSEHARMPNSTQKEETSEPSQSIVISACDPSLAHSKDSLEDIGLRPVKSTSLAPKTKS